MASSFETHRLHDGPQDEELVPPDQQRSACVLHSVRGTSEFWVSAFAGMTV